MKHAAHTLLQKVLTCVLATALCLPPEALALAPAGVAETGVSAQAGTRGARL